VASRLELVEMEHYSNMRIVQGLLNEKKINQSNFNNLYNLMLKIRNSHQ
jgi:hypothetical protein